MNTQRSDLEVVRMPVDEFHKVTREFHENMNRFVDAVEELMDELPQSETDQLDAFLRPYRVLRGNPFEELDTSGDVQESIQGISDIINSGEEDSAFMVTWRAILAAETRQVAFKAFFADLKKNHPDLYARLENAFQKPDPRGGEGKFITEAPESFIARPYQQSMRYSMILGEIKRILDKNTLQDEQVESAISLLKDLEIEFNIPTLKDFRQLIATLVGKLEKFAREHKLSEQQAGVIKKTVRELQALPGPADEYRRAGDEIKKINAKIQKIQSDIDLMDVDSEAEGNESGDEASEKKKFASTISRLEKEQARLNRRKADLEQHKTALKASSTSLKNIQHTIKNNLNVEKRGRFASLFSSSPLTKASRIMDDTVKKSALNREVNRMGEERWSKKIEAARKEEEKRMHRPGRV
ncbi:hypothetical protein AQUSIP_08160 [Aquicella siphonis]|uniref:DH domain-containing protein n=1 Tax=Aquicella siphonis TaxID=254247 RepID=A0A5E4PGN8_9COXI|nr:hypothetical protein [Aquicella siphonis]VVC75526.1 hypothetical protein AQUSIP_08160 [Aquicella siphonis]